MSGSISPARPDEVPPRPPSFRSQEFEPSTLKQKDEVRSSLLLIPRFQPTGYAPMTTPPPLPPRPHYVPKLLTPSAHRRGAEVPAKTLPTVSDAAAAIPPSISSAKAQALEAYQTAENWKGFGRTALRIFVGAIALPLLPLALPLALFTLGVAASIPKDDAKEGKISQFGNNIEKYVGMKSIENDAKATGALFKAFGKCLASPFIAP
jgi:hypothetical protein